jgi:hypothetical protein
MKIRKIVLMAIKGDKNTRRRLKETLNISEPTLYRLLNENDDDLTKAAALKVIREDLNLTDEEILEEEKSEAKA